MKLIQKKEQRRVCKRGTSLLSPRRIFPRLCASLSFNVAIYQRIRRAGAKFEFHCKSARRQKKKKEKRREPRQVASKKSRSCVPGIQSPAKCHHVPVIIQSERGGKRVFRARQRARIRRDLRQISRLPRRETAVRSRGAIARDRYAGSEQWDRWAR